MMGQMLFSIKSAVCLLCVREQTRVDKSSAEHLKRKTQLRVIGQFVYGHPDGGILTIMTKLIKI